MPPRNVLWDRDAHTVAKHRILRRYVDAWLPIMANRNRRLVLIDGFAGPGRYRGGEDGSPVILLKAYIEHQQRALLDSRELVYLFIENDDERFRHLQGEVDALRPRLGPRVSAHPIPGDFADVMDTVLDGANSLAPTFAFLDPFGYRDTRLTLTSRILGFPRCEVLIYFPTAHLLRFVGHPGTEEALTTLYGDERWRAAIPLDGDERRQMLHDLFEDALGQHARYVRSFEILTADGGGYHLFFGSNNLLGLEKMKEAMWAVDPAGGVQFRDSTRRDQLVLFQPTPDYAALRNSLRQQFGSQPFTLSQAEEHTLLETPFLPSRHLKRRTLLAAEGDGELVIERPEGSRRGTVPDSAVLRFT